MNKDLGRLQPIVLNSYKPLREVVCETLRQAIRDGVFNRATINGSAFGRRIRVSRTPVREAIRKLELEGFVVMIPHRGTYVADISLKDVTQVFEIRSALEELAAQLAAERITPDEIEFLERMLVEIGTFMEEKNMDKVVEADINFHEVLYKASRNERLVEIIHNLREQTLRFRTMSMNQPGRLVKTWEEHRLLVEAIADRNPAQAREIARIHMEHSEQALLKGMNIDKQ